MARRILFTDSGFWNYYWAHLVMLMTESCRWVIQCHLRAWRPWAFYKGLRPCPLRTEISLFWDLQQASNLQWIHSVAKSVTFLSLNICFIYSIVNKILAHVIWKLVFILFKLKKKSQHFWNSGCVCVCVRVWPNNRNRPFVYIEKVLNLWVQLMKNGDKNKSVAFIILFSLYSSVLSVNEYTPFEKYNFKQYLNEHKIFFQNVDKTKFYITSV